jgi:hypothetical protein
MVKIIGRTTPTAIGFLSSSLNQSQKIDTSRITDSTSENHATPLTKLLGLPVVHNSNQKEKSEIPHDIGLNIMTSFTSLYLGQL